jgi:hypothetical protein
MSAYQCFVCDEIFKFGPGYYGGCPVQAWGKEMICNRCRNLDGVVPDEAMISKLREKGISEKYNAKGFIIIPP